jgi:hypothetical protein
MPRFTTTVSGASDQDLEKSLDPMFPAMDRGRELIAGRASALEQARLRGANRELSRIAYKHGSDSVEAKAASDAVRTSERRVVAVDLEVERTRTGGVKADPQGVVVHGRVLDEKRGGLPNLTVAIVDPAGRPAVSTKTDDRGYFKLGTQPIPDAGGQTSPTTPSDTKVVDATGRRVAGAATGRQPRLVVLDGERELYGEDLEKLDAGQARYREIVLKARR